MTDAPTLSVLFYSKYVSECSSLMKLLDLDKIFVFCVDNAYIRSKILADQKWGIRSVPCLLQIYRDGRYGITTDTCDMINLFGCEPQVMDLEGPPAPSDESETEKGNELEIEIENEATEEQQSKSKPSGSISNIIQQMQRERESDDHVLKAAIHLE